MLWFIFVFAMLKSYLFPVVCLPAVIQGFHVYSKVLPVPTAAVPVAAPSVESHAATVCAQLPSSIDISSISLVSEEN
jgi:hypothetical protein